METLKKLPQELKTEWIAALRSGEYKQCKNKLTDGVGYCCLGVLCDIKNVCSDDTYVIIDPSGVIPEFLQGSAMENAEVVGMLTGMNDDGTPFSEIADWIEQNL